MAVLKKLKISDPTLVFVTTTTEGWKPYFRKKKNAEIIALQLNETAAFFNVSIVGYLIMPNHVHMLLGFRNYELLPQFIQSFKSLSSRKIKEILRDKALNNYNEKGDFKLWKRRYDDFIITSEKQFRIKLEYIHNNPVRKNLVDSPTDWEFSSAKSWLDDQSGIVNIDKLWNWIK